MIYAVIVISAFIAGYVLHDLLHRKEVATRKSAASFWHEEIQKAENELNKIKGIF